MEFILVCFLVFIAGSTILGIVEDACAKRYEKKKQELETQYELKRQQCEEKLKIWIEHPIEACSWLAKMFSDYIYLLDAWKAEDLLDSLPESWKGHKYPKFVKDDIKAAERIQTLTEEKREWVKKAKELEYKISIYESMFPDLQEYASDNEEIIEEVPEDDEEHTPIKNWLSEDEYNSLSTTERNALALERYQKRNKSKKEIGREYERYIGYLYESKGYKVEYFGILKGLNDMGRDLICTKGNTTVIIQCKCWSKDKVIHEKHINQLYGSLTEYKIQHRDSTRRRYKAAFYTTTQLSDMALAFADALKIEVVHEELGDFPMVKCNIGRKNMEKIYHLPFDLNYDKVRIEPERGESFAWTVTEAEEKGFRHAYKWIAEYGN